MSQRLKFDNITDYPHFEELSRKLTKKDFYEQIYSSDTQPAVKKSAKIEFARLSLAQKLNISPSALRFCFSSELAEYQLFNVIEKNSAILTSIFEKSDKIRRLQYLALKKSIPLIFIPTTDDTGLDLKELKKILAKYPQSFVTLSHINIFTGRYLQVKRISKLIKKYNSVFHLDISASLGKITVDLTNLEVDYATADAKSVGAYEGVALFYISPNQKKSRVFDYQESEYGFCPGFQNYFEAMFFAETVDFALKNQDKIFSYIKNLKAFFYKQMRLYCIDYKSVSEVDEHFFPYVLHLKLYCVRNFNNFFKRMILQNIDMEPTENKFVTISFSHKTSTTDIEKLVKLIKKHC